MSILNKGVFQGSKIPNSIFSNLEDITRKFLAKIHWKYTKEYTHFCDKKLEPEEEVRVVLFSNQTTESVFGHLKNNLINPNTTHIQLIHRTVLVFNDTLQWALNEDNSDEIFAQASKDRKQNKANSKFAAIEQNEELTPLGRLLVDMPLDPRLGKAVLGRKKDFLPCLQSGI